MNVLLALRRDCARRWILCRREIRHAHGAEAARLRVLRNEICWAWRLVRAEMRAS